MAILAVWAGLASGALAQEVYSANAVGYIKLVLPPGQSMISTPFVLPGGGTPTINDIFGTNMPNGSVINIYRPSLGKYDNYGYAFGQWYKGAVPGQGTNLIHRGSGFWIKNPGLTNLTLTLVGEVPGAPDFSAEIVNLPRGQSIVCFSFPTVTPFENSGLVPQNGDVVNVWQPAPTNKYTNYGYAFGNWYVGAVITPLVFEPGKAYWYKNVATPVEGKDWIQPKLYTWP